MFVADCLQVNKQGHLCMEELDVLELAAKYGTPLYVMSETQIRKNCRMYQDSLSGFTAEMAWLCMPVKHFAAKKFAALLHKREWALMLCLAANYIQRSALDFHRKKFTFMAITKQRRNWLLP